MSTVKETPLYAGVARTDITPDPAMLNWVGGQNPYDGILDRLSARALVLKSGQTEVAFITWELVDSHEQAVAAVRKAVHAATGIPERHILVTASHTHSGPRAPFGQREDLLLAGASERASRMRRIADDAVFRSWGKALPGAVAEIVKKAQAASVPVTPAIGRADAGEWLFNRRPIDPDGQCVTMFVPQDAKVLPDGLRFGPVDPTLTTLRFTGGDGQVVATLFSVPCHAVSVYGSHKGLSADWPGVACTQIADSLGGEALYLSGCAGEVVPARRGIEARDEMGRFFADRAVAAASQAHPLVAGELTVARSQVALPLDPAARAAVGADTWPMEVYVVAFGDFALVTLAGEPLNGLSREIQRRSPFAHTLVVGYTNGWGLGYIGLPGVKSQGGYEARAGEGTDECAVFLIETAVRLLHEVKQSES